MLFLFISQVLAVSAGAFSLYLVKIALWDRYCRRAVDAKRNAKITSLLEAKSKFFSYLQQHPIVRLIHRIAG